MTSMYKALLRDFRIDEDWVIPSEGHEPGAFVVKMFGNNPSADSGGEEDVIEAGGDAIFPATAQTLVVVSSSESDDNIDDKAAATLTLTGAITPGVHADITLTSDATNVTDSDTVTLATHVYTFVDTLSGSADEVLIGADAATSLANLKAAINGAAGAGTIYGTGTTAHASVVATTLTATTLVIRARAAGTAGNSIASTETSSHLSFNDTSLDNGVAAETVTIGSKTYSFVAELTESLGATAVANEVLFGADSSAALDNLKSAVNGTTGAGTTYGTGTTANASATAGAKTSTTLVFTAILGGAAGNSIASTETLANGAFGGATFAGGDDKSSVGATTVRITGVDADYNLISEDVDLDGTTSVTTTNAFLRVNKASVIAAGSNGAPVGDITITNSDDDDTLVTISAGKNNVLNAVYTVPAGYTAFARAPYAALLNNSTAVVTHELLARPLDGVFEVLRAWPGQYNQTDDGAPYAIAEKTDLKIRATSDTDATSVTAGVDLLVVQNI